MSSFVSRGATTGALLALSGCASLSTYNHTSTVDGQRPQVRFIDAKQRAVFSSLAYDDQRHGNVMKFCAEPSPDALSAIASAGNGGLSAKDKLTLQAAFSISESAASIGLRTQSIQMMRDSMYRLCEASISHNVSPQFWSAFRYFQNSMVTILAIEQLTGVVRGPAVQLTTHADVTPNKDVATITDSLAKAKDALTTDKADADDKQKALAAATKDAQDYLDKNKTTEDKLTDDQKAEYKPLKDAVIAAKTASDTAAAKLPPDQKKVNDYADALTKIQPYALSSGGAATTSAEGSQGASQAAVANAVQAIVINQLETGFLRQTCATLYDMELQQGSVLNAGSALHNACDVWAMNTAEGKVGPHAAALTNRVTRNSFQATGQSNLDYVFPNSVLPRNPASPIASTSKKKKKK